MKVESLDQDSTSGSVFEDLPVNKICVIVLTNPIPAIPSTAMIEQSIRSLKNLGLPSSTEVLVSFDGLRLGQRFTRTRKKYRQYFDDISSSDWGFPGMKVLQLKRWGHISQVLRKSLKIVAAPYVLIVQHDLTFIRRVDLESVVDLMEKNREVRHVRFNLRSNQPVHQDAFTTTKRQTVRINREAFFADRTSRNGDQEIPLVQTLCWSDNNHLCGREYLEKVILGPIGRFRIAPEWAMNKLNSEANHGTLGTFIYGRTGDAATIRHLDGRGTGAIGHQRRFLRLTLPPYLGRLRSDMWRCGLELRLWIISRRATRAWKNYPER